MYRADVAIFHWFNSLAFQHPILDWAIVFSAKYLDDLMLGGLLIFVVLPLLTRFSSRKLINWPMAVLALVAAGIARFGVTDLIRFIYDRPRPFEALANLNQLVFRDVEASFPSGHASFYFALAAVISRYYPKTSLLFFAAATLQALGRVTAGLHWPSDILAGAIIGIAVGLTTHWLFTKFLASENKMRPTA